jgi:hypothetical protein
VKVQRTSHCDLAAALWGENCVVVACRRRLTLWSYEAVYRAGRRMSRVGPSLLPLFRARGSDSFRLWRYPQATTPRDEQV